MRGIRTTSAALAAVAIALAGASVAPAALGPNPANHSGLLDAPIEEYEYDGATRCDKRIPPGTKALVHWLERHTSGELWGIHRCEKWGRNSYSVHAESRAIDWHMDARNRAKAREAARLIRERLLATDRNGNENALARRMGVQGIIYDCRAWFSSPSGMGEYSYCFKGNGERKKNLDPTAAHVDHIHIELNWAGARERTSFWRR
jgi:hypothetical protein